MNNQFSFLLAAARKNAGYTQEQAAERLNVGLHGTNKDVFHRITSWPI